MSLTFPSPHSLPRVVRRESGKTESDAGVKLTTRTPSRTFDTTIIVAIHAGFREFRRYTRTLQRYVPR